MAGLEMRYFVLSPASGDSLHAQASRNAIRAYATLMRPHNRQLAVELLGWLNEIEGTSCRDEGCPQYGTPHAHLIDPTRDADTVAYTQKRPAEQRDTFEVPPAPKLFAEPAQSQFEKVRAEEKRNLLEEPPEGWFVEKDTRTQNPTGYLVRTEDGTRKWYTDPMFKQQG